MERIETDLPGVCLLRPKVWNDARGFFMETYRRDIFSQLGIKDIFVQDNHSRSSRGAVRGLHYQLHHPRAKLCRVIQGEILDVAVDIRRGSPHFGKWVAAILSAENKQQIYIPAGFAHGYSVLSTEAEFLYKCTDVYHPEDEYGVAYNDPQLRIDWRVSEPIVSQKDQKLPPLAKIAAELLPSLR